MLKDPATMSLQIREAIRVKAKLSTAEVSFDEKSSIDKDDWPISSYIFAES